MAHVNAMAVSLPLLKVVQNGIKANSGLVCDNSGQFVFYESSVLETNN
jgi:hypothetical protein